MEKCKHCGFMHEITCPRIKAIEYHADGTVKRIEFHAPVAEMRGGMTVINPAANAAVPSVANFRTFETNK